MRLFLCIVSEIARPVGQKSQLQCSTDLVDIDLVENFDFIDNLKKIAATNLWFFSPAKARFSRKFCGDQFFY